MTDTDDAGPPEGEETATKGRTTAPQSDYTSRDAAVGALVGLVGVLLTFGVPLALL